MKKAAENLIKEWKDIIHGKKPNKEEEEKEDNTYLLEGENVSKRNNTRKKFFMNLENNLEDKKDKNAIKELKEKVVKIEEKLFETKKGEAYINRVLEILHNLKDKNNVEFREKIIKGEISPDDLCTMSPKDMLSKNKKEEIEKEIEKKVDEVRSDWQTTHGEVTEGLYKCNACGGKKTKQYEQQTRSADEPMTLFITCLNCGKTWKS